MCFITLRGNLEKKNQALSLSVSVYVFLYSQLYVVGNNSKRQQHLINSISCLLSLFFFLNLIFELCYNNIIELSSIVFSSFYYSQAREKIGLTHTKFFSLYRTCLYCRFYYSYHS